VHGVRGDSHVVVDYVVSMLPVVWDLKWRVTGLATPSVRAGATESFMEYSGAAADASFPRGNVSEWSLPRLV